MKVSRNQVTARQFVTVCNNGKIIEFGRSFLLDICLIRSLVLRQRHKRKCFLDMNGAAKIAAMAVRSGLVCFLVFGLLRSTSFAKEDVSRTLSTDTLQVGDDPLTWVISVQEIFTPDGSPVNASVARLFAELEDTTRDGPPFSRGEFLGLLKRTEARQVYHRVMLRYASPMSADIQKKEHESFTKVQMKESNQQRCLTFLDKHAVALAKAESTYGVFRQDIVALLAWESGLGKYPGTYRTFNVLMGQVLFLNRAQRCAVDEIVKEGNPNPLDDSVVVQKEQRRLERRKEDATLNVVSLLRECKRKNMDPLSVMGSWGGAIGMVQFMPRNLRFAVDGDEDGVIDLRSPADGILSVANFLKQNGYNQTLKGRQHALYAYNRSDEYVNGVVELSDAIWAKAVSRMEEDSRK